MINCENLRLKQKRLTELLKITCLLRFRALPLMQSSRNSLIIIKKDKEPLTKENISFLL